MDWGAGRYEETARELEPVAVEVIGALEVVAGTAVLDIGCGTGNAALAAARAGARATGIDPATRLLDVARERATSEGLDASFRPGDALDLPFGDGEFDVAVSVFALIFVPDPGRALAEALRVVRPGGEVAFTAWIPEGPVDAMVGVMRRAVAAATGQSGGPRFAWHDPDAVAGIAGGRDVTHSDGLLEITAASAAAYLARGEEHPMNVAMRPALERAGTAEATGREALEILEAANEDPAAFRIHSPYRLFRIGA